MTPFSENGIKIEPVDFSLFKRVQWRGRRREVPGMYRVSTWGVPSDENKAYEAFSTACNCQ
jgi:hypothetical protein